MTFSQSIASCFKGYVRFSGRASRSEFWYFALFVVIALLVLGIIEAIIVSAQPDAVPFLTLVFNLATFLPQLAVSVRRLHDIDKSGWWVLLGAVPLIGFIVLLIWYARRGSAGANAYGPDPLSPDAGDAPRAGDAAGEAPQSAAGIPTVRRD